MLKDLSEKTIILGVIDLSDHEVESAEVVAGRVRRAFIGIVGGARPLPPRFAPQGGGSAVEVVEVVEGSPADRAGLRPEDLIVEVDGRSMSDVGELQRLMVAESIGRPLPTHLIRGERTLTVELVPVELDV